MSLDVDAAEGFADHGSLMLDPTDVLVSIGEAARDHGTGLVLLFDEVQFSCAVASPSLRPSSRPSINQCSGSSR